MKLSNLNHCVYNLTYHLTLTTKYRRKAISAPILNRLHNIFEQTLNKWRSSLIEFNGENNHVHLLFESPPNLDLSQLVNNLKTVSSRMIRKEFSLELQRFYWKRLFWSDAYCIILTGGATINILKKYIQNQKNP